MSNQYWISNVGGECYVGRSDVYEGNEYVLPIDDDTDERQYSTLAGYLWDESETAGFFDDVVSVVSAPVKGVASIGKHTVKAVKKASKGVVSIGGDMVYNLNVAASLPSKAIKATLGQIPVIGKPIQAAVNLSPEVALGGLTSRVLKGERLDKAFLATGRAQIKNIREIAPYVQTVMTFVPGVGTGVAAAIAAGTALAEGRTITDAVVQSVRGAIPGGQLGQAAFDATMAVTKGQRLDRAALSIAMKQLPPNVQKAANAALAAAKGKNPKDAVLRALNASLPPNVRKAAEIGTALGAARTIQSVVVGKVVTKPAIESLAKDGARILKKAPPTLKSATKGLTPQRLAGFNAGLGAVTKSGSNAHALAAMREQLGTAQKAGFDHAVRTLVNRTNPNWITVVKGGKIVRGAFRKAAPGTKNAISGRAIINGKVQVGTWVR